MSCEYLRLMGRLLEDGHFDDAKRARSPGNHISIKRRTIDTFLIRLFGKQHACRKTSRFSTGNAGAHDNLKLAVGQTSDGCRMFADPNRIHTLLVRAAPTLSSRSAGGKISIPTWEWRTWSERIKSTRS